jgi:hypothetical protein
MPGRPAGQLSQPDAPMPSIRHSVLMVLIVSATPLAAQDQPRPPSRLHELGFLTGCWQGWTASGSTIEERYTTPTNNLMLGMTRYLRDGLTRSFEFHLIGNVAGGGSHLIPHPGGKASVSFAEKERGADRVVWENPSHDYPQRIRYARVSADSLVARIELLDGGRATEYRMGKVGCEG